MAGIGFRLQKLLSSESYTDLIKAYLFSSIIATGPMLVVMATLILVKGSIESRLSIEEGRLFLSLIVYVYAFSMVGVGPFLYVVTRYLADKHYLKQTDAYTPTYFSTIEIIFAFQGITALIFLIPLPLSWSLKWVIVVFYLLVSGTWMAMVILSAARNYNWILIAFIGGGVIGWLASIYFGKEMGLGGFLNGYTLGQAVTFTILTARIMIEFGFERTHDYGFLFYYKKYPLMAIIGVAYYLGTWIDKFVFWFFNKDVLPGEIFRVYPTYDTPMFLAFLTIVPSMAFFLVEMETSFAKEFHAYYESIKNRDSLGQIRECENSIRNNVSRHFQKFALFQGLFSTLIITFITQIADVFHLNPYQLGILRIGILGAFLQMGFVMILNIFFYFDFQKEACLLTIIYAVGNALFAFITLQIGLPAYGFGYAVTCFITVLLGFFLLDSRLKSLNYWTFMKQPIVTPKFKFETEGN